MNQKSHIEPGLLPVFRLLTTIRLGLTALASAETLMSVLTPQPLIPPYIVLLSFAEGALTLCYLSWPKLQNWLGQAYLPLGIVITSASPIITQYLIHVYLATSGPRIFIGAWQLLPILMISLVVVAWQYNFRSVLLFCLGTLVLDAGLMLFSVKPEILPSYFILAAVGVYLNRTVLYIAVGFMVTRLMQTQREQHRALIQANAKLSHYATTLEQLTTSRERNRLARELHDTLAHTLSALAVQLGAVDALWESDPAEARDLLGQCLLATRSGLTETRRALHDLRASPLEDLGLVLALQTLTRSFAARNGLEVTVHVPEYLGSLSHTDEQCIYRVAQEALANISRHAAAQHVNVRLEREAEHMMLTVRDDGQGFEAPLPLGEDGIPATGKEQNLGLRGMYERAEMAGGTLIVESSAGEGTTVRLVL